MTDINLKDEQNQKMIKLICDEDIETIEEEVEFKIFKLAKSLKQKKITKSPAEQSKSAPQPVVQVSEPQKEIKINFYRLNLRDVSLSHEFTFSIDTSTSVDHLIKQLTAKEIVS